MPSPALRVGASSMPEVARLGQLEMLGLSMTEVTDAGLKELAGLRQLRQLFLVDSGVTDAGMKELAGVAELKNYLPDCEIRR
jgi:internalin A